MLGKQPAVAIENAGPGMLRVDFDSPDDNLDESMTLGVETQTRTLPGPLRVRILPIGSEHAVWRLKAWNADGLRADLILEQEASTYEKR